MGNVIKFLISAMSLKRRGATLASNDLSSANRAIPRLQPMRLIDILDGTFSLYRNHFGLFFRIALVYFGVALCRDSLSNLVVELTVPLTRILGSAALIFTFLPVFAFEVMLLVIAGGIDFAGALCYLGRPITPSEAFRQIRHRFWPFLGYIIVLFPIAVILRMAYNELLQLTIYRGLWGFESLPIFWGAYIVIPFLVPFAIYLGVRWGFGALPILFEETSLRTALRRSSKLVKGTWWRVFGIYTAIYLLWWTLFNILHITVDVVLSLIGVTTGDTIIELVMKMPQFMEGSDLSDTALAQQSFFSDLIEWLPGSCLAAFLLPIKPIGYMLLYFDLRIRKEGFDIEMMVNTRESLD